MTSLDETKKSIEELGYFCQEDLNVGQRVDAIFEEIGYHFRNKSGLTFIKTNIFENQKVRSTVESFFPKSSLAAIKSFGPTDYDCCFLNRFHPELRALIVNLWMSDSVVMFHVRSHHNNLIAQAAPNGLLKIPPESLGLSGIFSRTVVMKTGGLSIMDARTGFKIFKGQTITFAFVVPDELPFWAKMGMPTGCGLEALVQQIQETSDYIGANFEFQHTNQGTSSSSGTCRMCCGTGRNGGFTCGICGGKK
ncbi:hypothetical protein LCI18_002396 [Fusarium solani-melongenae]|uniref:Uncharacterized protein n=1 Tax=Fusarium solani subsp. cucurbitae TaxID=2747967 RepID=A0ACD3YS74_FUSSC|nr:hypothetical protein LCI18_002396 [Fusarium solani-melongenae]